jgi:hypothetical protein
MYRTVVTMCPTSLTFNNSTFCPHSVFMFCVDLRTNSHYFPIKHQLTGFYNRDGVCLLRGTDWSCKNSWGWCWSLEGWLKYFLNWGFRAYFKRHSIRWILCEIRETRANVLALNPRVCSAISSVRSNTPVLQQRNITTCEIWRIVKNVSEGSCLVCQKDRQFVKLSNGFVSPQSVRDESGPSAERLDRSDSGLELQDLLHS